VKIVSGAADEGDFVGLGGGTKAGFFEAGEDEGVDRRLDPNFVGWIRDYGRGDFLAGHEGPVVALGGLVCAEGRDFLVFRRRVGFVRFFVRRPNGGSEQRSRSQECDQMFHAIKEGKSRGPIGGYHSPVAMPPPFSMAEFGRMENALIPLLTGAGKSSTPEMRACFVHRIGRAMLITSLANWQLFWSLPVIR